MKFLLLHLRTRTALPALALLAVSAFSIPGGFALAAWEQVDSIRRAPPEWFGGAEVFEVTCKDGRTEFRPSRHLRSENMCHDPTGPLASRMVAIAADPRALGPLTPKLSGARSLLDQLPRFPSLSGAEIRRVDDLTSPSFASLLSSTAILVMPGTLAHSYDQLMSEDALASIREFVKAGGVLVSTSAADTNPRFVDPRIEWINRLFDLKLVESYPYDDLVRSTDRSRTSAPFRIEPEITTLHRFFSSGIRRESLPSGSAVLFAEKDGPEKAAVVALIPYGKGYICWLGTSFRRAIPHGRMGKDWYSVLNSILDHFMGESRRSRKWEPALIPNQNTDTEPTDEARPDAGFDDEF